MRLAPDAFWAMSLKEWRALAHARRPLALCRAELEAMMKEHPDG